MAFSFSGGSRRSRFRGTQSLSEINIVPLVDVVLVLLIIFMLTAHVMEFGMEVEVPQVKQSRDTTEELPVVTITKNGMLYLNEQGVNINELGALVRGKFQSAEGVYVRADKETVWDVIAQVVSELNEAKFKVNMVTQPLDESERVRR